ncbi:helix-turn-helix transcriptional regulator [Pseudomonas sp.]|uniref:helix-turn-helix domain-containing protein n=1 Tax=Pseudomonas sp. TaxID=306 RepID=UPI00261C645F|nr:helix-turn-helix transcriptional regulator [Pseudomonas sp.]
MSLQEFLSLPHLVDWHRELVTLLEGCRRPDFPRQLSATLKLIIDHENVILKVYQSDNDKPHLLYHDYPRALEPQYIDRYLSAAYLQDPVLYSIRSGSSTGILQINSQTCQLQGSEYFDMYYKELRLDDEIDVLLPIDNRCHLVLSIGRRGTPPTTPCELQALQNLYPILVHLLGDYWKHNIEQSFNQQSQVALEHALLHFGNSLLTRREREIVALMLNGNSSKHIARQLSISVETVKVHRKNIYTRLNINSELQLCSLFLKKSCDFHTLAETSAARVREPLIHLPPGASQQSSDLSE